MSQLSYAAAGVSIDNGDELVERIKPAAKRTLIPGVLGSIGGFGALFEVSREYRNPVLVTGTDGVGTKLMLAFQLGRHDTVGQDLVAMSVNDILVQGAKSLFFLDYYACGKLDVDIAERVVKGIAKGCELAGCALIGGETAEMPGFYPVDEYDVAGFAVGLVDKKKVLDLNTQKEGDVLIALPSSGIHSNGYSLIRKVFTVNSQNLARHFSELGTTLGEALLMPTKIYVKPILSLLEQVTVKSIAHITGGGFYENIPRALKKGLSAQIEKKDVKVLPIFDLVAKTGNIPEHDMFNTFNMGVGMMVCVAQEDADKALETLRAAGEDAYVLGTLVSSDEGVILK